MSMLEPESSESFDDIQHTGILHTREDDTLNANIEHEGFSSGPLGNHPGEAIQMLRNGNSHHHASASISPDPSAPLNLHENSEDLGSKGSSSSSSSNPSSQHRKYGFLLDSGQSVATTTRYAESDKLRSMRAKKEQREKRKENKNVKTAFKVEGHDQYDYNRVLEFLGETTKDDLKKGKKTQKSGGAVTLTSSSGNGNMLMSANASGNGGVKSKASRKKSKEGSDQSKSKTYHVNGNAKAHSAGEEEDDDDDDEEEDGNESDNVAGGVPDRKVNGVKNNNAKKVITKSNSEESSSTTSSRQRELKDEELIKFDHNSFMVMVNPPDSGDLRRQTSRSIENLSSFTTVTKKKKKKSPTLSSDDGYHNYAARSSSNSIPDYRSNNNNSSNSNININNNIVPPVGNGGFGGTHSRNKFHANKSQSGHVVINMTTSNNNSNSSSHSNPLNRDIIKLFHNVAASGNNAPNGVMGTNSSPSHSGSSSQSSSAAVTSTTTTDVSAASSVPQSPPSTDLEFGAADFPPLAENLAVGGEETSSGDNGPTALPLNNAPHLGGQINNNIPLSDNVPYHSLSSSCGAVPPPAPTWPRKAEALLPMAEGTGSSRSPAHSHSSPLTTSDSQTAVIPPKKNSASEAETPPSLCGPPDVTQGISPNLMNALPDVTAQAPYLADSHSGENTPPRQQAQETCSTTGDHCDNPPSGPDNAPAPTASVHQHYHHHNNNNITNTNSVVYRADSTSCGGSSVCEPGRDISSRNSTASFFLDTDNNVEIVLTEEEYNRRREFGSAPVVILSKSENAHGDWLAGAPDVEFGFDINQTLLNVSSSTASSTANPMAPSLAQLPSGGMMYLGGEYAPMAVIPPTTPISHVDGAIVSFGESIDPVSPQANFYSSVMSIPDGQGMTWAEMVAASSSSSGPGSPEMMMMPPNVNPSTGSSHTPMFQPTPEDLSPRSSGRATPVIESSIHYATTAATAGVPPPSSTTISSTIAAPTSSSTSSTSLLPLSSSSTPTPNSSVHLNYLELVTFVASAWQITREDLTSNLAFVYSASQFLPKSAPPSSATPLSKSSSKAALS